VLNCATNSGWRRAMTNEIEPRRSMVAFCLAWISA
jgi:hypothetical protein